MKNVFLKRSSNGKKPTSFTIQKKTVRHMPANWPTMVTRDINAQMLRYGVPPLTPVIDVEAHVPESLQLFGRHQELFPEGDYKRIKKATNSALLIGVNRYDHWLQTSLGSSRELKVETYTRGSTMYVRTNLSIAYGVHELVIPMLSGIKGIQPRHFRRYVHGKHMLGFRVDCDTSQSSSPCYCKRRALDVLPAMWVTT